jgi:hypothetical protein
LSGRPGILLADSNLRIYKHNHYVVLIYQNINSFGTVLSCKDETCRFLDQPNQTGVVCAKT